MHADNPLSPEAARPRHEVVRKQRLTRLLRVIGLLGLLLVLVGYLIGCAAGAEPRESIEPTYRHTSPAEIGDQEAANQVLPDSRG